MEDKTNLLDVLTLEQHFEFLGKNPRVYVLLMELELKKNREEEHETEIQMKNAMKKQRMKDLEPFLSYISPKEKRDYVIDKFSDMVMDTVSAIIIEWLCAEWEQKYGNDI